MATVTSKQFTLNVRDVLRGILMAFIGAALPVIYDLISNQGDVNWSTVWKVGAAAAVAYLIKNFFSPTEITVRPVDQQTAEAVKSGEAEVKIEAK